MSDQAAFDDAFGANDGWKPTVADEYKKRIRAALEDHAKMQERKAVNPFAPEKTVTAREFWGLDSDSQPQAKAKADYNDRTKAWLKKRGYEFERADHYDARLQRHKDLLGMFDYLAFGDGETIGVQVTAKSSVSTRRKKIQNEPRLKWIRRAGWKVLILGFETGSRDEPIEVWM